MIYAHLFTTEDIPPPFADKNKEASRQVFDERLLVLMIVLMLSGG